VRRTFERLDTLTLLAYRYVLERLGQKRVERVTDYAGDDALPEALDLVRVPDAAVAHRTRGPVPRVPYRTVCASVAPGHELSEGDQVSSGYSAYRSGCRAKAAAQVSEQK
jgi:hypothetical protein